VTEESDYPRFWRNAAKQANKKGKYCALPPGSLRLIAAFL
jgi:hypothetical protein